MSNLRHLLETNGHFWSCLADSGWWNRAQIAPTGRDVTTENVAFKTMQFYWRNLAGSPSSTTTSEIAVGFELNGGSVGAWSSSVFNWDWSLPLTTKYWITWRNSLEFDGDRCEELPNNDQVTGQTTRHVDRLSAMCGIWIAGEWGLASYEWPQDGLGSTSSLQRLMLQLYPKRFRKSTRSCPGTLEDSLIRETLKC